MKAPLPLLLLSLVACGGATSAAAIGASGQDASAPDGASGGSASPGSPPSGPYPIACTFYRRGAPTADFTEGRIEFMSDVDGTKSTTVEGRTFEGTLAAIPDAPDDVLFKVSGLESEVTQEFRLRRRERPAFEYIGFHGFTGLAYVGADAQYICTAGAPSSSPVGGSEDVDPPLPVRARCTVDGRDGARSVLEIDGPGTKKSADGTIEVMVNDDPYEGRSIIVDFNGALVGFSGSQRQLFQIARTRRLVNLFGPEHGFTGRTSSMRSDGTVVGYACAVAD